jgi:DNA-binding transcriptional ArsR family regulator
MAYNNTSHEKAVLENVIRALAEPRRREILERISSREVSVKELTARFKISQPAVSQHLALLRRAGLVSERHEGRRVYYRINPGGMMPLMDWLTHYKSFWPERIKSLEKLLQEMDK